LVVNGIQVAYRWEIWSKERVYMDVYVKLRLFQSQHFSWETPMFRWPRPKVVECPPKLERRSWERTPTLVRVFCKKHDGKDELSWSACLVDISRGGLRLLSPHKFDETTTISIENGDGQESAQSLEALVVRAQPALGGGWCLGCALTKELEEEEMLSWVKKKLEPGTYNYSHDLDAAAGLHSPK
jgi:PilZ domain